MLSNISYRYKIPASLSVVIVITALAIAAPLISSANDASKRDLIDHALELGKTLSRTLQGPMLHDELWQAYEIITTPFDRPLERSLAQRAIIVLDAQGAVYVATDPKRYPSTQPLTQLGTFGAKLAEAAGQLGETPAVFEDIDPDLTIMAIPILAGDQSKLGTVVLEYSRDIFVPRFVTTIRKATLSTALVLLILVPLAWLWGKRIASPLLQLSTAISKVPDAPADVIPFEAPAGRDEIGRLGVTFKRMLDGLREKESLKQQMMASERLAAVGRLTAGIAHEINNPLGGMLNAISNYKRQPVPDAPFVERTLSLLERGLTQIRDTVAALLVEARFESHALTPHDIEDVRTLLLPNVENKHIQLAWQNGVTQPLPLPSTEIRQIMLNLLLNAVEAADDRGRVSSSVSTTGDELRVEVENDGAGLSEHQLQHLFEPFAESRQKGRGLGLWMTYQLASQLKGNIQARSRPGQTVFTVTLPLAA